MTGDRAGRAGTAFHGLIILWPWVRSLPGPHTHIHTKSSSEALWARRLPVGGATQRIPNIPRRCCRTLPDRAAPPAAGARQRLADCTLRGREGTDEPDWIGTKGSVVTAVAVPQGESRSAAVTVSGGTWRSGPLEGSRFDLAEHADRLA
jgi:hypothetical protein